MPRPESKRTNKPPLDLLQEIDFLPEWLLDELSDPLSTMTPGQAARLGTALSILGTTLTEQAKTSLMGAKDRNDHGVIFDTVEATSYPTVNNEAIKSAFPQESHPKLYRKQNRKAHVTADMPFDTKKIRQLLPA